MPRAAAPLTGRGGRVAQTGRGRRPGTRRAQDNRRGGRSAPRRGCRRQRRSSGRKTLPAPSPRGCCGGASLQAPRSRRAARKEEGEAGGGEWAMEIHCNRRAAAVERRQRQRRQWRHREVKKDRVNTGGVRLDHRGLPRCSVISGRPTATKGIHRATNADTDVNTVHLPGAAYGWALVDVLGISPRCPPRTRCPRPTKRAAAATVTTGARPRPTQTP